MNGNRAGRPGGDVRPSRTAPRPSSQQNRSDRPAERAARHKAPASRSASRTQRQNGQATNVRRWAAGQANRENARAERRQGGTQRSAASTGVRGGAAGGRRSESRRGGTTIDRRPAVRTEAGRPQRQTSGTEVERRQRQTAGAPAPRTRKQQQKIKTHYIPSLDGLRALAVLAVIAYHMGAAWAPGGLLGVTVFFVLSGYLITSLLLIEIHNTGTINLPQFWLRRVRRLFPAIVLVIVSIGAVCTVCNHELLTKLRQDALPALCWITNWWYIFHDVSYFEALGAPSPLTHFWSLAIEEQFYLVWPLILFGAHKLGVPRNIMRNLTLVLALASAAEMALLFDPAADPSRVYYGTDTRAFSLLIGAWLAYVWPSHQLGADRSIQLAPTTKLVLDGVGLAALAGLLVMIATIDGFSPFLYRGGILLASVLTAVVIAVLVHPASLLGRIAGFKPFVWIGLRSYGIYLWHYPIILLITPPSAVGEHPWWLYLIELLIIVVCAALSYRFVEDPFRHGALGAFVRSLRDGTLDMREWFYRNAIPACVGAVLLVTCVGGLIFVPDTSAIEGADLLKDESAHVAGLPEATEAAADEEPKLDVLMIGDSVSVRTIPYFEETFPYGAIDAAVNRQLYEGQQVYDYYADQDIVGDVVVIALGTNGVATDEQLDDFIADIGTEKKIFFINTRSPLEWVGETNDAIARAADRHDNVSVIDWYGLSEGQFSWFDGDDTHLSEEGAQAYIAMVNDAIGALLPEHEEGDEAVDVRNPNEQPSREELQDQFFSYKEGYDGTLTGKFENTLAADGAGDAAPAEEEAAAA